MTRRLLSELGLVAALSAPVALAGMVAASLGDYSAARPAPTPTPVYVLTCADPGRAWCGGDVHAVERYAPDGHYRDDGSIPLAGQVAE